MNAPLDPEREIAPVIEEVADGASFEFGTKGSTLASLAAHVSAARLCDQLILAVDLWRKEPETVISEILERFGSSPLAIRSSSTNEDTVENSNAGAFHSVTGVAPDAAAIRTAVESVVASYGARADGQEVLIQTMVQNVALSGVVLTRDLDTGGPYYVINYDDFSGRTDTVTGGAISKTVLVHRGNPYALHSPRMQKIIALAAELERVTGRDELDIEFCVTDDVELYLLQVRPLAARARWKKLADADVDKVIRDIRDALARRMTPQKEVAGATTIYGEMPDWNPAEMIGTSPKPLAMSLYKHVITDGIWAEARSRMGYRHVDAPLMVSFGGRPYIDTRLSLNSFLPADVDDGLAERLVDHQLARLAERPDLHDKIEFEIAITCRDLNDAERRADLIAVGFDAAELDAFFDAVGRVTARALGLGAAGLRDILALTDRLSDPVPEAMDADPLDRARFLLDRCKTYGTLPFSELARHAFIGVALLRSMARRNAISEHDAERFMRGIHTVASDLVEAMGAVAAGTLTEADFLAEYGHLRPGTYDILSWRYDERPDLYLGHSSRSLPHETPFAPDPAQLEKLRGCLVDGGFDIDPAALLDYIATAIAARERAKFAFTRSISDALAALVEWGDGIGLSREDLSYIEIDALLGNSDVDVLRRFAERAREAYDLSRAVYLPHLIVEPDDIDVIRPLRGQATFITGESVTARAVRVEVNEVADLDGRIVLIESADPGFDWIFSHDIAALITKFGGANSHMAIRCAEFGLPAAIGCGEKTFEELVSAATIELNCAARSVRPVGR